MWGVGDCQARGSGGSVGGSGVGSGGCKVGVNFVLLGHIHHVHLIKWLGVLVLPRRGDMGIVDNGGGGIGGRSSAGKTAASGVASFFR